MMSGACVDRSLTGDAAADAAASDASVLVDLAIADASVCSAAFTRRAVPLSALQLLEPVGPYPSTAAFRFVLKFPGRSCDVPADVAVTVRPSDLAHFLTAEIWQSSEECGAPTQVTRELTIGANPRPDIVYWFSDGVPGATVQPIGIVSDNATPTCVPAAEDEACDDDCDCNGSDPAMLCLWTTIGERRCARACHEDAECRGLPFELCSGAPDWVCRPSQACRSGATCPFGDDVEMCACTPPPSPGGGPCACDADCPAGRLCGDGNCVQVCTGAHTCQSYGEGAGGTACRNGQCVQVM